MASNTKYTKWQIFHIIYSIILSISIVVAGICLITACVSIYNLGGKPFSRESVTDAFSKICIPVYICLALTVAGFVLDFLYSRTDNRFNGHCKPYRYMLASMCAKKDLAALSDEDSQTVTSLRNSRKIHFIIRTALILIASAVFLVYALNSGNYDSTDINGSVIRAMYIMIPCFTVAFAYSVFTLYYNEKSLRRELDIIKKLPAANTNGSPDNEDPHKMPSRLIIRYALLTLGVAFLVYGILTGGVAAVLTKAANICTECIGLG